MGEHSAPELIEQLTDYFQISMSLTPRVSGIDGYREGLFELVLRVWTDLGGELTYSPTGPLVRFVTAVLQPILGNRTPKPRAILDIMKREQKRHLKR